MTTGIERILIVSPHPWGVPHPVNDHIADLATGFVQARHAGDAPQVLVAAPSHDARARRAARRALRDLANGVDPGLVFASEDLRAAPRTARRRTRSGAPAGDFPVLALGVSIGQASVAVRANLHLLMDRGGIDLVHVHDPLDSDFTRALVRRWTGLTAATFHEPPEQRVLQAVTVPLRERILDAVDLCIAAREEIVGELAAALGRDAAQIAVVPAGAARAREPAQAEPGTDAARTRTGVVIGRGNDDDVIVGQVIRSLRSAPPDTHITLLGRWQRHHRPSTPRWARGRLHAVQATSRERADEVLLGAQLYVALPGTHHRAVEEAVAAGVARVAELAADDVPDLAMLLADPSPPPPSREYAPPTPIELSQALLRAVEPLAARRRVHIAPARSHARTSVVDLHMHTNHSWDCATDPEALLFVARKVGLTAIAVTDHNEVSGALACAELAGEYGVQVIVGEEVKTSQGEVIGLFLRERIEPGLTWEETIRLIRAQDGLVYVPHPFDRLHTIPDVQTLRESLDEIDLFETYNARLTFEQYNRDAERFARKYNLIEGAGSDAHVVQGLGTAAVHMPAWDDPESFLGALRQGEIIKRPKSLLYLQGLKFLDTMTGRTRQAPTAAAGGEP